MVEVKEVVESRAGEVKGGRGSRDQPVVGSRGGVMLVVKEVGWWG